MILSIQLDSEKLDLLTASNKSIGDEPGFFSVDSFSLLIGSNGAGKTRFLRETAWAFHDTEEIVKANIHFSGAGARSKARRQEYGVIYYTPIPYRVDLPKNTRNFYNATPTYGKSGEVQDVNFQYYELVKERLGFDLRPMVVLGFDRVMVLTALSRVILGHLSKQGTSKDSLFSSSEREQLHLIFREFSDSASQLQRHFTNAFAAHLVTDSDHSEFSDDVPFVTKQKGTQFILSVQKLLSSCLGDRLIPVVSALEHVINLSRKKVAPVEAFIRMYLLGGHPNSFVRDGGLDHKLKEIADSKSRILQNGDAWSDYRADDWVGKSTYVDSDRKLARYRKSWSRPALVSLIWENFSSGQLALLYQFSAISRGIDVLKKRNLRKFLILLDEGDIFLHAAWQREYVKLLDHMMGSMKGDVDSLQLILTSHSTSLLTDIPRDCVKRLKREGEPDGPEEDVRSFAASLEDIVNTSFETATLGRFAQEKINGSIRRPKNGTPNAMDEYILSIIDDPILAREMKKLHRKHQNSMTGLGDAHDFD